MKLLDKFRSQPEWQSEDPAVRVTAVRELSDEAQDLLLDIARHDEDPGVRRAAVGRLTDQAMLADILRSESEDDEAVKAEAAAVVRELVIDTEEVARAAPGLAVLSNARDLAAVARSAHAEAVGLAALARLTDPKFLGAVARRAKNVALAHEALSRITDREDLLAVALKADDKTVALAAYERLVGDDGEIERELLESIARRAKQKVVARRAKAALNAPVPEAAPPPPIKEPETVSAALEALVTTDDLNHGRRVLDATVERWAAIDATLDTVVTDRFAAARRAVEDRLLALEAAEVEVRRADAERAAAVAARVALCERVERLNGPVAVEQLNRVREEWATLVTSGVADGCDGAASADIAAFMRRFEEAATACAERHDAWVARHERVRQLDALATEIEQLVATDDHETVRAGWSALDKTWHSLMVAVRPGSPGEDAATNATIATLQQRKEAAGERRRALGTAAKMDREREAQANLTRLQRLSDSIDAAVAEEKLELGVAERLLRAARRALDTLPPLPARRDRDTITRRLRQGHTALLGRVRELRDFADWQRWANLGVQEELCREMEALGETAADGSEDDARLAGRFRDIMDRWSQAADVPRDKGEALWQRFKQAHDAVYPRCQAYFETWTAERKRSLERQRELVEEAERLSGSTDWIKTAQRITELQAAWKALGPAPRKEQRELWNRFRKACSGFFTRRKADLAQRKQQWAQNLEQKEALCARVEALADASDLARAIAEVKKAQTEWQTVGPVRRTRSEAVWQRFRAASDRVVDRLKEGEREAAAQRIAAREALCAEIEALVPGGDGAASEAPEGLVETVRAIQDKWRQAPEVPHDVRRTLATRFGQAVARLVEAHADRFRGTDLDPAHKLGRLEKLCTRAEALVPAAALDEAVASPAEILAKRWREQLANNTMGVRVDEAANRRAAIDEVKRLQAERRRLGALPGEAAQQLSTRFQRACDRVFQRGRARQDPPAKWPRS